MLAAFNLVDHNILFRKLLERGLPLLVVCCLGIALKSVMSMGFLMEFVREVFSILILFFLLCIWMPCCPNVVLFVTGGISVMLMTLFYSLLVI